MQSSPLVKAVQAKLTQPAVIDTAWMPAAINPVSHSGNLEEALRALAEAEYVIRTQAQKIRRLESLAMTDELTGLLNRRGFIMSFHRELALARRDASVNGVLIMVDLDGFKAINDTWGHSAGDDYLQAVAHTLLGAVRSSDLVARLGGDEFAIVLPRMNEVDGRKRLAKLEKEFNSRMIRFGDESVPLRASFGFAAYTGTDTPEAILAHADLKLYAQKARRRAVTQK